MEMGQIRYALSAAKHLNFTRAAEDCGVSQPALTKGIKALETELGAPLSKREAKKNSLSGSGRSMLPHFQSIADEAEAARALAEFERRHDGIEFAVSEAPPDELVSQLEAGAIDVAILMRTYSADEQLRLTPLYDERYVVVFPPGHRLGGSHASPLEELSGQPYVNRLAC